MAVLTCRLEHKSLDEVLLFAACVKWKVDPEFFNSKGKKHCPEKENDKRRTVHWLMWKDCGMNFSEIGKKFGYSKQGMQEGIDKLDFMRGIYLSISQDIEHIREIAGKLQTTLRSDIQFTSDIIIE